MSTSPQQAGQQFDVPPAPKRAWVSLVLLTLVLPIGLAGVAGAMAGAGALTALALVGAVSLPLSAFLLWAMQRRRIQLDADGLRVDAAMYRKKVGLDAIDCDGLRVVNLEEHPELRPRLKTNGFAIPGYQAGYFRLGDRSRAFCLITEPRRTLLVPQRDGPILLISPERPQVLCEALRAACAR